jgi:hypothetical protein
MEANERETQNIAEKIKEHILDATSMRELCQTVIEEAKTATKDNVAEEDMVVTLVTY